MEEIAKAESVNPFSVVIAEDEGLMRHTLKTIVEDTLGHQVVGETAHGAEAESLCRLHQPSMLITDLGLPDMAGEEVIRNLLKEFPELPILVFSVFTDYRMMVDLIGMGVKGFLHKREEFFMVESAIRAVAAGKLFICGPVEGNNPREVKLQPDDPVHSLTQRETEILVHIAEGYSYKEIADKLSISYKTVEKHRSRLSQKLEIRDNVGLALFAVRKGLVNS